MDRARGGDERYCRLRSLPSGSDRRSVSGMIPSSLQSRPSLEFSLWPIPSTFQVGELRPKVVGGGWGVEADDSLTEPDQKPAGPSHCPCMEALQGKEWDLSGMGQGPLLHGVPMMKSSGCFFCCTELGYYLCHWRDLSWLVPHHAARHSCSCTCVLQHLCVCVCACAR